MRFLSICLIGMLVSNSLFAANIKKQKSNFSTTYNISMTAHEQVHLREEGAMVSIDNVSDSRCPEGMACFDLWPGAIIFNISIFNLKTKTMQDVEIYYQNQAVEVSPNFFLTNVVKEGDEFRLDVEFRI